MNMDRTFCSGVRCKKVNTCDRSMLNLRRYLDATKYDLRGRPISVSEFSSIDQDGCPKYVPLDTREQNQLDQFDATR